MPAYAHLPLATNAAGEKLKQILGARDRRASAVVALMVALRFLGHNPPDMLATAPLAETWAGAGPLVVRRRRAVARRWPAASPEETPRIRTTSARNPRPSGACCSRRARSPWSASRPLDRPSHEVAHYLQRAGYTIVPVNPAYGEVLGQKCYPSLHEVPGKIDIVDVFRAGGGDGGEDEAIAVGASSVVAAAR